MDTGRFYKDSSNAPVALAGRCKNLIDLGPDYTGPVPPAYGGMGGTYIADPDHDRSEDRPLMEHERRRRASELVAFEIYGPPPTGWICPWVTYADGNPGNFAPANVRWMDVADPDPDRHVRQLMLSDEAALKRFNAPSRGGLYRPHGKAPLPDVFVDERLDVSFRHRMVHTPPNRVDRWHPDFEKQKLKALSAN